MCSTCRLNSCDFLAQVINSCQYIYISPLRREDLEVAIRWDGRRVECPGRFLGVISRGPSVSKPNQLRASVSSPIFDEEESRASFADALMEWRNCECAPTCRKFLEALSITSPCSNVVAQVTDSCRFPPSHE